MTALWTHETVAQATGGKALGTWSCSRVEIDSRKVQPGDLFVALKGERFDGHDFVADAFARGATAAVISRAEPQEQGVVVTDTQKALEDLGAFARQRTRAKVVGVTGSVGKTSAKEMVKLGLSAHGKTFATSGNYNNHIGTPLNLANLPMDADFAVLEMGMNHAGEIARLTRMVRPQVAVVTAVDAVHLEFFDSIEAIARAKAEIFQGVPPDGVAILNADSTFFPLLAEEAKRCGIHRHLTFGKTPADCRVVSYRAVAEGCEINLSLNNTSVPCRLAAMGEQWALLAALTMAVCYALGLDIALSAQALASFSEPEGRGRIIRLPNGASLIDDSYNASPASMLSAFAKLADIKTSGRKFAALGDMLELGPTARDMHEALAHCFSHKTMHKVYTAGGLMKALHEVLPKSLRGEHVANAMELLPVIQKELRAGDVLLIKGSHGSKMHELAAALAKNNQGEKRHAV